MSILVYAVRSVAATFYECRGHLWGLRAEYLVRRRNQGLARIQEIDRLLATM
jgi:hypothetical protein